MKLLILTRFSGEYEPKRLAEEAKKKGIGAEIISYEKIGLSWNQGRVEISLPGDLKLSDFDSIIPRSSAHHRKKSLVGLKTALIRSLPERVKHNSVPGKVACLNRETYSSWPVLGKIEQGVMLAQNKIPVIPSWYLPIKAKREKFLKTARFPLICKARFGSHSKKTFKVENKKEAEKIFSKYQGEFFFQPLIKSAYYWRVLVLGGKILGVMERRTNKKFLPLLDPGSKEVPDPGSLLSLRAKIEKLALEASAIFKAEFSGVDILIDKDRPLVIEINRSPQFRVFEKRVGVNVAGQIVDYLLGKRLKK